jgi:hypothetical protein
MRLTKQAISRTRKKLLEKLEELRRTYGEEGEERFFRNFYMNLPSSNGAAIYESIVSDSSRMDRLQREMEDCPELHSKRYLNQTPREFFETVRRAIAEEGVDVARMEFLQKVGMNNGSRKAFHQLTFPVFVRLVAMGYTERDITR